jgi:uncharacterized protein YbjT (DUF2867 family)
MTAGPVLVTGAAGRQGGTVLRHLLEAAARSPAFITTSKVRDTKKGDTDARRLRRHPGWRE